VATRQTPRTRKTEITKQRIGSLYSPLDRGCCGRLPLGCNSASRKQLMISPRPFDSCGTCRCRATHLAALGTGDRLCCPAFSCHSPSRKSRANCGWHREGSKAGLDCLKESTSLQMTSSRNMRFFVIAVLVACASAAPLSLQTRESKEFNAPSAPDAANAYVVCFAPQHIPFDALAAGSARSLYGLSPKVSASVTSLSTRTSLRDMWRCSVPPTHSFFAALAKTSPSHFSARP
jgi:hypothetical protein